MHACVAPTREVMVVMHVVVARCQHAEKLDRLWAGVNGCSGINAGGEGDKPGWRGVLGAFHAAARRGIGGENCVRASL